MGERKQAEGFFFFSLRRKYHCVQTLLLPQMSFQSPDPGSFLDRSLSQDGGRSLGERLSFAGIINTKGS